MSTADDGIVVLSLFDGMSCGRIALERAGVKVKQYYAAEIDKHAIAVAQANYPNTIQLGSVTGVSEVILPKVDLPIGGSPCQSFSFAGKMAGMTTTCNREILTLEQYLGLKKNGFAFQGQSYLFWEYVRILKEVQPEYFLLENVMMQKKWQDLITGVLGVQPVKINSALVSAQNRKRLYWTNIPGIRQPEDKGILLKNVLEEDVDDKYYLSGKMVAALKAVSNKSKAAGRGFSFGATDVDGKTGTIRAGYHEMGTTDPYVMQGIAKFGRTEEAKKLRSENIKNGRDYTPFQAKEITGVDYEKSNTIPTAPTRDTLVVVAQQGRPDATGKHIQQLEPNTTGKTNTLTSVQKDNLIMQDNRAYYEDGKSGTLDVQPGRQKVVIADKAPCLHGFEHESNGQFNRQLVRKIMIRRLTPVECERLQTVPDGYTAHVSDTQRYRMLGNGWTVDVVAHIFKAYKNELILKQSGLW